MKYEMILDFAVEEKSLKTELKKIEKKYNLKTKILRKRGPGGGWPEILFVGSKNNLLRYAREYFDNNKITLHEAHIRKHK